MKLTEQEIRAICQRSVQGFYEVFERRPTEREQQLLVDAITRMVDEPTAPSTRLQ